MNRVKSLSKSGNPKKDQAANLPPTNKDVSSASSQLVSAGAEDVYEQRQEVKVADTGRRVVEKDNSSHNSTADVDKHAGSLLPSYPLNGREEKGMASSAVDRERFEMKSSCADSNSQKIYSYSQNSVDTEDKVQKVSPPRRKVSKEEKSEKFGNWLKKDTGGSDTSTTSSKQHTTSNYNPNNAGSRQYETESPDGNINAILEVGFRWHLLDNHCCCCLPVFFKFLCTFLFIILIYLDSYRRKRP